MRRAAWLCIVLLVAARAASGDWTIEKFQWSGDASSTTPLEIVNQHGDVRTRSSGIDEIEVLANIQRMANDPFIAVVKIHDEASPVKIAVEWKLREDAVAGAATDEMTRRRVDVTVILPRLAPLRVETSDGLIEAKGHGAAVTAESVSGEIRLSTEGTVTARTDRGAIDAVLTGVEWDVPAIFTTGTGDITVWLPAEAEATVEAETQGVISTDYSIDILRAEPDDRKVASATIGGGGSKIQIQTIRGQIRLFRWPK
jgi:hypothetical protein